MENKTIILTDLGANYLNTFLKNVKRLNPSFSVNDGSFKEGELLIWPDFLIRLLLNEYPNKELFKIL